MGKLQSGINGPFTGLVGTAVGTNWMGKAVIRSRPKKRTKPFSPAEIQQHEKFRLMNTFLNPVMDMLNRTYKPVAYQMTGYNKGFSYNVKNVITGTYPSLGIDFSMVLLGRGDLPNVTDPKLSVSPGGPLEISWTDNSGKGMARETDMAYAAAFSEEHGHWKYEMDMAARRAGACTLDISTMPENSTLHVYLGFMSADAKNGTNSMYLGTVNI